MSLRLRFEKLSKHHGENFQRVLNSILQSGPINAIVPAEEEQQQQQPADAGGAPAAGAAESEITPKTYESVQALQSQDEIASRCASEVAGVELLKTASGKILIVSEKKRILPKLTLLGGFGTGKHLTSK